MGFHWATNKTEVPFIALDKGAAVCKTDYRFIEIPVLAHRNFKAHTSSALLEKTPGLSFVCILFSVF